LTLVSSAQRNFYNGARADPEKKGERITASRPPVARF
jgi:hypothetical protein